MPDGQMNAERQAIVSVRLHGPDGTEVVTDAIVDTGYTEYLILPAVLIEALNLRRRSSVTITLADGTDRLIAEYEGYIWWNHVWRLIPITAGKTFTLLGMTLFADHTVCVEVVKDGAVTIEPVEE